MKRIRQFESSAPRNGRRRGFTLIEVILALAIFLLGALAIVRIFPPALAAVQGSGNRVGATRLATSAIERMNLRVAGTSVSSAAEAIYPSFYNTVTTADDTFGGAFNGTINRNQSLPRDARFVGNGNPANDTALKMGSSPVNSGSYVNGETQRVMKDGSNDLFVLTNFSYTGTPQISIEDTIEGVRIKDSQPTSRYIFDFSNAKLGSTGQAWSYGPTDSANPEYPITAGTGSTVRYYISYKWIDAAGRVHGVDDEPYAFFATPTVGVNDSNAMRVAIYPLLTGSALPAAVQGEVKVRMVRDVTMGSGPTGAEADDGLRGLYVIHSPSLGISAGDAVRISYTVADWRTIIADQTPARDPMTGKPNTVSLTTRGLDEDLYGDEVFAAAYSVPNASGVSSASLVRGSCIPASDGSCTDPGNVLSKIKTGGSETNQITVGTAVNSLNSPTMRVAYRPEDGWGVQAAVAARTYMPYLVPNVSSPATYLREPWREYSWKTGSSNLYFQPNEAGKILVVSFEYSDGLGYHIAKDRIVTVGADVQNEATADLLSGFTGAGGKVAVAELVDLNGIDSPNVTAILSVRGLSVQARAVWADNQGRYSQTVVTDYRKSS